MKTKTLAFIVVLFVSFSAVVGLTGCTKEPCYDCEKNVGQPDESKTVAIGEDDKEAWEAQGYTCTANGDKAKPKK